MRPKISITTTQLYWWIADICPIETEDSDWSIQIDDPIGLRMRIFSLISLIHWTSFKSKSDINIKGLNPTLLIGS